LISLFLPLVAQCKNGQEAYSQTGTSRPLPYLCSGPRREVRTQHPGSLVQRRIVTDAWLRQIQWRKSVSNWNRKRLWTWT